MMWNKKNPAWFSTVLCFLLAGFVFTFVINILADDLVFVCRKNNDLFQVVKSMETPSVRFDKAEDALATLKTGDAALFLADGYPETTTNLSEQVFEQLSQKQVKAYIEFPGTLPGFEFRPMRRTRLERVVVLEDVFGEKLKPMDVLAIHDCHFVETEVDKPLLVLAGVAGYDTAVYGIDDVPSYPILFKRENLIVSTTKLSQFVTARYATYASIQAFWP